MNIWNWTPDELAQECERLAQETLEDWHELQYELENLEVSDIRQMNRNVI